MKAIRVRDAARLRQGGTALMAPATRLDRFRIELAWESIDQAVHGMPVDEIRQGGRHGFAVGDELAVKGIDGIVVAHVIIDVIQLAEPERLVDADFAELGYASKDAYMASWGQVFGPRCWWFRVHHIDGSEREQ